MDACCCASEGWGRYLAGRTLVVASVVGSQQLLQLNGNAATDSQPEANVSNG